MSGRITHSWDGTVLTISSDSGTSSMDLKGDKGCRGPQGPAGVIIDELGNIDWNGYATEVWVEEQLADVEGGNVDLTGYATEDYVNNQIEKAAIEGVDLTGYATEEYVTEQMEYWIGDTRVTEQLSMSMSNFKSEADRRYALKTEMPNLEDYATKQYVADEFLYWVGDMTVQEQMAILLQEFVNNTGLNQRLKNYYTKEEVDQAIAAALANYTG